jgi:hypothetical protein
MSYGVATITSTATLILGDNPQRLSLVIINGGSDIVHYGPDAYITTANTPYLIPDTSFAEDSSGTKLYCGPFYGITTGGTSTVYYWERIR